MRHFTPRSIVTPSFFQHSSSLEQPRGLQSPATTMIEPPRVPIELRLLALEAKVSGVEPYSLTDASSGEGSHARARPRDQPESSRSGLRRISEIQTALDKLGQESEGIKRFLSNCTCIRVMYCVGLGIDLMLWTEFLMKLYQMIAICHYYTFLETLQLPLKVPVPPKPPDQTTPPALDRLNLTCSLQK